MPVPESFLQAVKAGELELSARQLELLELFLEGLLETNKSFNLTSVRDPEMAWHKHVLESLALARFLDGSKRVADIGSGGGLPGIPLAISMPETHFTLIEATGKKARFLQEVAAALNLNNVTIIAERAEDAARAAGLRESFDAVVVRAVGSLAELVELGVPLLRIDGRLLAVKGEGTESEVRAAARALSKLSSELVDVAELLPKSGAGGRVMVIKKLQSSPGKYPRKPGIPKKRPL
jgi:16S rRNA (guanine527-N7)-methyltransferase